MARLTRYLLVIGLTGAALIYGDGIITPAISVLSAVEGLNVATDTFALYTMPIAATILLLLFLMQRFGTSTVGKAFGPVMLIWFVVIAVLGIAGIVKQPHVLVAIDPRHAVTFLARHGFASFAILGAVFLSVTGAEAMYADMGHMGRKPIRIAWFALVLPALLLNYAGQTALVIGSSGQHASPLFRLAPAWALYPLVVLATAAAIIASQAIITGAFSLTRQAVQLGWFPGVHIEQTSSEEYGEIYVPFINWMMMLATLTLTVSFASSDKLAGAYGTAVSTTMLLTTALLYRVMRVSWRWPALAAAVIFGLFLFVDLVFFSANLLKVADGGWIPLLFGTVIFIVMTTWRTGEDAMHRRQRQDKVTIEHFVRQLRDRKIKRVPGSAIFLTRLHDLLPPLIADHVRQMGALHEEVVALTVRFSLRPRIDNAERIHAKHLGKGFWHVTVHFGFIEVPNIPNALHRAKIHCPFDLDGAVYFSERDKIIRKKIKPRLPVWRRLLFSFLYRNAVHPADLFSLLPQNFVQTVRYMEI